MPRYRPQPFRFCHGCPSQLPEDSPDPDEIVCPGCGMTNYRNAGPVANLIVPYQGGVIFQKRAIHPVGTWSLPGGYIKRELWQRASGRESWEEACVEVPDPENAIIHHLTASTPDGSHLVVFGKVRRGAAFTVKPFRPSGEATDRTVIIPAQWPMFKQYVPFNLHIEAVDKFFAAG